MSSNTSQEQFTIPEQTLRTLSFCEPTPRHLAEWVGNLPMINLGESSRQLYHAIIELNQLITDPENRLKLIEAIRPSIQQVSKSLSKHYLNQPVLLPGKARKVSRLAMALDNHLMVAYKCVLNDRKRLGQSLMSRKPKKITALAVYHAMTITTQMILRAYHLYNPAPEKAWHELHQLYLIAESNGLLNFDIEDKNNHYMQKTSIADAYKRALMIGCCKANQIRQRDITSVFEATELWSKYCRLVEAKNNANFIVNLNEDAGPVYSELASGRNSPFGRGIDLDQLLEQLKDHLLQSESKDAFSRGISIPKGMSKNLINYLIKAWETLSERSSKRLSSDKSVSICIGFSATHYYLSGGVDFESQLQRSSEEARANNSHFQSRDVKPAFDASDPWSNAFDTERNKQNPASGTGVNYLAGGTAGQATPKGVDTPKHNAYPKYTGRLLDISPNGYCIKWSREVPCEVKAGEIVGINEQGDHNWIVGVIRWISHSKTEITTMGVELLASAAIPCGARVVTEGRQKSEYMRALLLPALEALGQPASFIAPNMPFKENLSVILNQYGETSQGLLGDCTQSTGSFSQFIFETESLSTPLPEDEHDDDDIWPDI